MLKKFLLFTLSAAMVFGTSIATFAENDKQRIVQQGTNDSEIIQVETSTSAYAPSTGKFTVRVTPVSGAARIRQVYVPVWCEKDQRDLIWHEASLQQDGSYLVTVDIRDHQNLVGIYQVNVYVTDTSGKQTGVQASSCNVTGKPVELSVENVLGIEEDFLLTVSNLDGYGDVREVLFPVWSETGGQDDLVWYPATANGDGTYQVHARMTNHHGYGKYNVHTYVRMANGSLEFVGETGFYLTRPTAEATIGAFNLADGTFTVTVRPNYEASGVSKVMIPIWSAQDQSDLVWYEARKQEDGSYRTVASIENHQSHYGTYQVHVYITDGNDNQFAFIAGSCEVSKDVPVLEVNDVSGNETQYQMILKNANRLSNLSNVKIAVWSIENGQDDLAWYNASQMDSTSWQSTVSMKNHKGYGTYKAHAYAFFKDGSSKLVSYTEFTLTKPTVAVSVGEYNTQNNTFSITVTPGYEGSGISKADVAVWSAADQSNLSWYPMQRREDGTYQALANLANHGMQQGYYQIHVYLYDNNQNVFAVAAGIDLSNLNHNTSNDGNTNDNNSSNTGNTGGIQANQVFTPVENESYESDLKAIQAVGPYCTQNQRESGVLACVTLAQFILESGYGGTDLAQNANNCFGMKVSLSGNTWGGSTWDGTSVYTKVTGEQDSQGNEYQITADFRRYSCVEDSIADHSAYLLGAKNGNSLRYEGLKGETDYRTAVTIIKNGGYATDVNYIDKICEIIERWNLTQYNA